MFSHPFSSTPTRARRLITAVALLAYVASVVGYPLPLPAAVSPDSTSGGAVPFPCQGHACGCQSAAHCFDSCCCHSAAERLAWARRQAVPLPAETVTALERQARQESTSPPAGSCCQHGARAEEAAACSADATTESDAGLVWLSAIQAQKCQGLATLWITSGANLPLVVRPLWQFDWAPAGETTSLRESTLVVSYRPDVPPPRR